MVSQPAAGLTIEEYLELERQSEIRHEYVDGEMVAMAGGSPAHGAIAGNIYHALRLLLKDAPCLVFTSNVRISPSKARLITYPDVTVACEPLLFSDEKRDTITNPRVVIEVLSPSTSDYDRGFKTRLYRTCASVEEYLLVDQTPVEIEHGRRLPNGHWDVEIVTGPGAVLELRSINCHLPSAEIYAQLGRIK